MSENKTGKYFKYAIGEIVLVVLGILIALQINNWNQSQKEKQIEKQYINNIIRDLKEQMNSVDTQMKMEQSYYESAGYLIEDYNKDQAFTLDSIFYKHATVLANRKTFVIIDPTYTDLISSGNINIIKNQSTKDQLLNYYQELERIEKIIQNNNSLLIDQHYLKTFLKNAYHYENLNETFGVNIEKFPGYVVVPNYETDIEEISKNVILKDENKLELMNTITIRLAIAFGHYESLINVKFDTQSLIAELEQE
ncbi:MAG: hypothetical protein BM563_10810 [Bacteroidetes bacterium MedPE-SWsnd-G1]|nr:MAG: hypothetical protein BM563_10810 [Bacteroidetes bacterium MedPE-SWsnd-G1]